MTIRILGSGLANHQAFKQHAMTDDGVFWLSDQPLERLIFHMPMDVMQQNWLEVSECSEAYGPFQITAGYSRSIS